jgi:hypothetical protein
MYDPVIERFAREFERFHQLLLKQIDICPESLWEARLGNWYFWQELVHSFYCAQIYALSDAENINDFNLSQNELLLVNEAAHSKDKEEVREIAVVAEKSAQSFFTGLRQTDFLLPHANMNRFLGGDKTNLDAAIGLIRHYNYHLGECDAILRKYGLSGVY